MERPEYIKNYVKPKNTTIKFINGNWYLYERTPYYDGIAKRMKWRSGKILGKIAPDGHLVDSKHRAPKTADSGSQAAETAPGDTSIAGAVPEMGSQEEMAPRGADTPVLEMQISASASREDRAKVGALTRRPNESKQSIDVETAAVEYIYMLTEKMREGLQYAFPDCWQVLYTIAMLRAINGRGGRLSKIDGLYRSSYLAHLYPNLEVSKEDLTPFMQAIGQDRAAIVDYMKFMRDDTEQIAILDGHRIICQSKNIKTATCGFDTKHRYKPQINLIYLFTKSEGSIFLPGYYKQFTGSTNDMKALEDLTHESGLELADLTLIGDKGCMSSEATQQIEGCGSKYVLGVKRGTYGLSEKTPSVYDYDGEFSYHKRGIQHYTIEADDHKTKIVVYFDCFLFADELSSKIARNETATGKNVKKTQKDLDRRKKNLVKAENAVKRAEETVSKAEGRVAISNGNLAVAQRKMEEAATRVAAKQLSLSSKQDKLNAAKSESKKEQAAGVVARAEASEAQARAEQASSKAAYYRRELQLAEEQRKLSEAQANLDMARIKLKQSKESVEAGEQLLALAKANAEDAKEIFAENSDLKEGLSQLTSISREIGTFALKTNRMDLNAEEIYLLYKQRPAIEEFFKIYDSTLGYDASYMQTVSSEEAWLFLNHLASTMAVLVLNEIADSGQTKNVSYMGLMDMLSSIRAVKEEDGWHVRPIEERIQTICDNLGFDPGKVT